MRVASCLRRRRGRRIAFAIATGCSKFENRPQELRTGPRADRAGNAASSTQPAVDYALPEMQALTDELGLDCVASAAIHDEIVILARSGTPRPFGVYVLPGQRLPLTPPIGTVFVAWSSRDEIDHWLGRLGRGRRATPLKRLRSAVDAVRECGYLVGLEGGTRNGRSG